MATASSSTAATYATFSAALLASVVPVVEREGLAGRAVFHLIIIILVDRLNCGQFSVTAHTTIDTFSF